MDNKGVTRNVFLIFAMVGLIAAVWAWRRPAPGSLDGWGSDLHAAADQSRASGKPVLVYFTADWCPPCKQMKSGTWTDARVREAMQAYVPVMIDVDSQPDIARHYRIQSIPQVMVLDMDQRIVSQQAGLIPAPTMVRWLADASR